MIFYHNHTPKENETVKYNILKKNNAVVIFGMDKVLASSYPISILKQDFIHKQLH